MGYFSNKVVFITGASSGIGAALARACAGKGAKLVLTARRLDRLQALAEELAHQGAEALPLVCDVTAENDLTNAATAAVKHFGKIDIVIANAGFGVGGRLDELSLDDYRRQFEVNIFGLIKTVYATLAELKNNQGHLVLMGSVNSHISIPGVSAYCMSKFSLKALADALHQELASQGVAVTLISPGFISTEIRYRNNRNELRPKAKDPIPSWIQMPADQAARKILTAISSRRREAVVTWHGKILVLLNRIFPSLVRWITKFLNPSQKKGAPK